MKKLHILKKPLRFSLLLLPVVAVAAVLTVFYQFDLYDEATIALLVEQMGSVELVLVISVLQPVLYGFFASFFGYILANKLGLLRPLRFEKKAFWITLALAAAAGVVLGSDPWTFGAVIPALQDVSAAVTPIAVIAAILYGGIVEELLLRLFVLSLLAWLLWKVFFRKRETVPAAALIMANLIAALLFAAWHLPATAMTFGELTPLLLFRCFLLNGGFGLLFGWLYRKHGIQYSMLCHAGTHIVSRLIWILAF